jgi:UDP-GlcNAc:undecaprenyl-phosphate GlcNAc-1-phosphate transferase
LSQMSVFWLTMLTGGALTVCAVGLADDILDLSPKHKIVGQILGATFLVSAGIRPQVEWFGESATDMVHLVLNSILVYVFVLGATNSLNLLDGLDGLCAGVTSIMTVGLLVLSVLWAITGVSETDDPMRLILCLALLGSVLGFLPFNRHPARIFMGDAGSLLLGFFVAVIMIFFAKSAQGCLVVLMIFGLPLLDTSVSLARRWLNQKPLFKSDRGHVYDQIMDRGQSQEKTVALCYGLCSLFVSIGLLMSLLHVAYSGLLACLVLVVSGAIVWRKGFFTMNGLRGAIQK